MRLVAAGLAAVLGLGIVATRESVEDNMHWQTQEELTTALESCFKEIQAQRMAGLPILNPVLDVQAINFCRFQGSWLGILITPWFMNLMTLQYDKPLSALTVGEKQSVVPSFEKGGQGGFSEAATIVQKHGYKTGSCLNDKVGVIYKIPPSPPFSKGGALPTFHGGAANENPSVGAKNTYTFPAGQFEFTVAYEPALGFYQSCSLYSPMFAFPHQELAVEAANAALRALLEPPAHPVMSRRDLLRGRIQKRA